MLRLVVLSAVLAVACAGLLGAPLLPRVEVAPAQVNIVKQPIVVHQPEYHYRAVPVPVAAVTYSHGLAVAPLAYAAPSIVKVH